MEMRRYLILIIALLIILCPAVSQEQKSADKAGLRAETEAGLSVTRHTVRIGGQAIAYTATVGELVITKPDEKPGAKIFFTAYTRSDIKDLGRRPITFCYNGGPGSSSVWLHMGGIGPRRVRMNEDGSSVPPPFGLEENEYSILDVTDLVFIDPVSTGFSRPLAGENKSQFHGIDEDISSVGEFIRLYTTRFERWRSPKFLLGESYGTFRSAGLSGYLQNRQNGLYLNGIVLVSSVLDFQTIRFASHHNLPYILFLPHYTATAWYHKKLPGPLQSKPLREVVDEAKGFASEEYAEALFKGNRLSADE
jgi:carboxypeptidase C (cathepsin A)